MPRNNSARNTKAKTYQAYSTIPIQLPYNSAWGLVNLATDVTGVLAVEHGGTGVALTAGTTPITWIGTTWDTTNLGYSYYYGITGNSTTDATGNVSVGQNALQSLLSLATNPPSVVTTGVGLSPSTYTYRDVQNGKAHYNLNGFPTSNTVYSIIWTGAAWIITNNLAVTVFTSASNTTYPWQATGWTGSPVLDVDVGSRSENNIAVGVSSLRSNTSGYRNIAIGTGALQSNTTAERNLAIGYLALNATTTVTPNLAIGDKVLMNTTTGVDNVGVGAGVLEQNTTGIRNVGIGSSTLRYNTSGGGNVAIGYEALKINTTAGNNMAVGDSTLANNTTGVSNAGIGGQALRSNTTGSDNLAFGFAALQNNTIGIRNAAFGSSVLTQNIDGNNNAALGFQALTSNLHANSNCAFGVRALQTFSLASVSNGYNTAVGAFAAQIATTGINNSVLGAAACANLTTGSTNTILGYNTGQGLTTGSNNTIVGANVTGLSNPSNNIIIADGAGNQRIVGNSTGQITIPYKGTSTETSTSPTFTSALYGQTLFWSPTGTATATLPANGAAVGSWFDVIIMTDQDSTIQTVGATGTMTTGTTTVAKSVGFVTAGQRIGSMVRFYSNGTVWIAINLGSTVITVTT